MMVIDTKIRDYNVHLFSLIALDRPLREFKTDFCQGPISREA